MRFDRRLLAQAVALIVPLAAHGEIPRAPAAPASAVSEGRRGALVMMLGGDFGSSEVLTLSYSDGSKQRLDANDGGWVSLGAGFLHLPLREDLAVDTLATIGLKYRSIGTDGGGFRYLAFPLEVEERLWVGPIRFCAGVSLALRPSFKASGDVAELLVQEGLAERMSLKRSLGLVAGAEWIGMRHGGRAGYVVGIRYLFQKLAAEGAGAALDANAFGIVLGLEL